MKRVGWLTDIHLNFVPDGAVEGFLASVAQARLDALLVSGDIAEAPDVLGYLTRMHDRLSCPVYFVLGNHDYYFGSIAQVRQQVTKFCRTTPGMIWLNASDPLELTTSIGLVGHDGWADARLGDYER